ncbi:MAG: TRAP transporter small permease [Kiloniellales bacterium]
MQFVARARWAIERFLEIAVIALMIVMTAVVVLAVVYRKAGASFSWYDEVASVLLAWITYYGAALAALRRAHIGFDGILRAVNPSLRLAFVIVGEAIVAAFFIVLAWTGLWVLEVLQGETLVSLTSVPVRLTQSVIPIGAVLFLVGQALSLPKYWRELAQKPIDEFEAVAGSEEGGSPS